MTAPARGFTDLEFAGRVAKIQAAMALHDVGALLLTGEAEIRYVTGFMTQFWQKPNTPLVCCCARRANRLQLSRALALP